MIYLICGDDIRIIEYKKIKEELEKDSIVKIFDGSIEDEYDKFQDLVFKNNLFSFKELLVLKRGEKVKKLEEVINNLIKAPLLNKNIIIDIEDIEEKFKKKLNEKVNVIFTKDDKINSKKIEYIEKRLGIKHLEACELFEIINGSFNKIENEIEKIEALCIDRKCSIKEIKDIISKDPQVDILSACELFLNKKFKEAEKKIRNSELAFIYTLSTFLKLCMKIKLLNIKSNSNYEVFLKKVYPLFKDKINAHPYFVFKNINRNVSLEFIENILLKLLQLEYNIKDGTLNEKLAISTLFKFTSTI